MREDWVDIAKAIAIMGIVLWHMKLDWISHELFQAYPLAGGMWPVPVFFMLAGFFLTDAKLQQPKTFIAKKARRLYVPTVCLYLIATLLHNVFISIGFYSLDTDYEGQHIAAYSAADTVKGLIASVFLAGRELILSPMWFACVLFVALCWMSLASYGLKRIAVSESRYRSIQLFTFLLPALAFALLQHVHPIDIPRYGSLFRATWLVYVGMFLRTRLNPSFDSGTWAVVGGLVLYSYSVFPCEGLVSDTVCTVGSCYLLCYLSKRLANHTSMLRRALVVIGRDSFYIMALHLVGFKVCTLLLNALGADIALHLLLPPVGSSPALFLAYLAAGTLVPIAIMRVWRSAKNRLCLFVIGQD